MPPLGHFSLDSLPQGFRRRHPPRGRRLSANAATGEQAKWQASWKNSENSAGTTTATITTAASTSRSISSARSAFLCAYALAFSDPPVAALIGWLIAMPTRQAGHFFFEPKGYDHINEATHEHKEEIKVGYNLQRKVVLLTIWALSPLPLYLDPTLFGLFEPHKTAGRVHPPCRLDLAVPRPRRSVVPHRAPVLHQGRAVRTGVDDQDPHRSVPRHQAVSRAPLYLMRGELIDPRHAQHGDELEEQPGRA